MFQFYATSLKLTPVHVSVPPPYFITCVGYLFTFRKGLDWGDFWEEFYAASFFEGRALPFSSSSASMRVCNRALSF